MTDITEEEIYDAVNDAMALNLKDITKGRGQYYLQVYVGNKEYKEFAENTRNLANSMNISNEQTKKINTSLVKVDDTIKENNNSVDKNTKEVKDNTKSSKENTEALKSYGRRFIESIAKASGVLGGMVSHELALNKTISESNAMYMQTAKEMNVYADRMGLTLDEYAQFLKENASEFNTLQRQFGDVREALNANAYKIMSESGATRNEINKGLTSFTKLMTTSGEINNMSSEQFVAASERYVTETKLLAKALGVSTDAVLKQTEQAQKQWQMELLMKDPNKIAQIQAAQAAGHDLDRILYEVGGIMSEGAAVQMALSPASAMEMQQWRERSARGEMNTMEQVAQYAKDLKNNEAYRSLSAEQQEKVKNNMQMILYNNDEKFARGFMGGTGNDLDTLLKIAEYDKGKQTPINESIRAQEQMDASIKAINNAKDALAMMGTELPKHLDKITNSLTEVKNKYDEFVEGHPKFMRILQEFINKLEIAGFALNMLISPITGLITLGAGIWNFGKLIMTLPTKFGALWTATTKLTSSLPKVGTSLTNVVKNFGSSLPKIGTSLMSMFKGLFGKILPLFTGLGAGLSAINTWLLSAPKMSLGTVGAGLAAFTAGQAVGKAIGLDDENRYLGKKVANVGSWFGDKAYDAKKAISNWWYGEKGDQNDVRNWSPEKLAEARAKIAKLQDSNSSQIASSQVQNKAEVQAEAKIKAETEAEAKQSKDEQKSDQENVFNLPTQKDNKTNLVKMESEEETLFNLREMVGLLKEMTNHLSQMSSQIPMNNYGSVN